MEDYIDNVKNITETKQGVVTFLDVLGWKGIYYKDLNAIDKLISIVEKAKNNIKSLENIELKIFSISDTIIIISNNSKIDDTGKDRRKGAQLLLHAKFAKNIINMGINQNMLIRGATSYGKYSYNSEKLIFMGEAIDEAAEWHENTDWCGVILTPKAQMEYDTIRNNKKNTGKLYMDLRSYWIEYKYIPLKSKNIRLKYALNWYNGKGLNKTINKLKNNGPYGINIANKYLNTIDFIGKMNIEMLESKEETAATIRD